MPITPPISTLQAIQQKVRRLTRSPSIALLSDDDLNQYINTYVVYDFPETLRTFNLKQQFTFYAKPYQDVYVTDTSLPTTDPLYDFQNKYVTIQPPVYVAGYQAFFTQSPEQLFNIYPKVLSIQSIGTAGDGSYSGPYTGTLSAVPIVIGQVLFSSVGVTGQPLALKDVVTQPFDEVGFLVDAFNPSVSLGTVNYVTGAYTFSFTSAPAEGAAINSQTLPYQPSLPQAVMYFQNQFTLRPVPDQPYPVNIEVFKNPVALLDEGQTPELNEWWQLIAFNVAKKVFEDRMDTDSIQQLMPALHEQELLVNRRTIVQLTNQRIGTIYTEQTDTGIGNNNWTWGPF